MSYFWLYLGPHERLCHPVSILGRTVYRKFIFYAHDQSETFKIHVCTTNICRESGEENEDLEETCFFSLKWVKRSRFRDQSGYLDAFWCIRLSSSSAQRCLDNTLVRSFQSFQETFLSSILCYSNIMFF